MKLCTLCNITIITINQSWCKKCKSDYLKEYRKNNSSHIKKLNSDWRVKNKEHYKESKFDYYSTITGRLVELNRTSKRRAKKHNLNHELTTPFLEDLWKAQGGLCAITKLPIIISKKRNNGKAFPFSPSIDRIDINKGYLKNNVRLVCYAVNCALHDYGEMIFKIIANAYINNVICNIPIIEANNVYLTKKQKSDKIYRETENGIITILYNSSKNNAKNKNLEFGLSKEFIKSLIRSQNNKCALTGIIFNNVAFGKGRSNPFKISIDRIDSSKGYMPDNVRLVCVAVNYALNEFGEDIFKQICEAYLKDKVI